MNTSLDDVNMNNVFKNERIPMPMPRRNNMGMDNTASGFIFKTDI